MTLTTLNKAKCQVRMLTISQKVTEEMIGKCPCWGRENNIGADGDWPVVFALCCCALEIQMIKYELIQGHCWEKIIKLNNFEFIVLNSKEK